MKLKLTSVYSLQAFQLMRYATVILIGVVMAKSSLGMDAIGAYEQFIFLAGCVSFFWLSGLIRGLLPLYRETDSDDVRFFNAFLLISLLTTLSSLAVFLLAEIWFPRQDGGSSFPIRWMLAIYLFCSVPAGLTEYYFLLKKKSGRIVVYGVVSYALMLGLVLIPALLGWGIGSCMKGLAVWAVFRYLVLWVILLRYVPLQFSKEYQLEHIGVSVPLILSALVSGSAQYVDGFIVRSKYDESVFAIFRFGAREFPVVLLMANAFSNAMLPAFASTDSLEAVLKKIKKESSRLVSYLFPLCGLLLVLSHMLFPLLFNQNFAESATVFNIYLLLITSRLLFPQTLLIGLKQTSMLAWAAVGELLVNVSLSVWFVQFWGIQGVAFATVLAYLFEKGVLAMMVESKLNISLTKYQNISRHLIYSLFLLFLFYIVEFVIY